MKPEIKPTMTWQHVLRRRLDDGSAWTEGFTPEEVALPRGGRYPVTTYKAQLPNVFPYVIEMEPHEIQALVRWLLDNSHTSFAVTVEGDPDTWSLWVSRASQDALRRAFDQEIKPHAQEEL